jgi:hypothetical protein
MTYKHGDLVVKTFQSSRTGLWSYIVLRHDRVVAGNIGYGSESLAHTAGMSAV